GVSRERRGAAVAAGGRRMGGGGWRAAQRALQPEIQAGFGPELAVPADTVLLQNNHLRLCGSGGTLLFDPTGLAEFRGSAPIVLAREFLRTRLSGGRPAPESLRIVDLDLLAAGRRALRA